MSDHAQKAVIDDGDLDVDFFLDDGSQLAHGHLESAIAHNNPDFGIGLREFGADSGGKSETHRTESTGGDQRAGAIVVVILRFPHLVLADVGDDDGLTSGFFPKVVDDMSCVEVPTIWQALNVADG